MNMKFEYTYSQDGKTVQYWYGFSPIYIGAMYGEEYSNPKYKDLWRNVYGICTYSCWDECKLNELNADSKIELLNILSSNLLTNVSNRIRKMGANHE